MDIEFQSQSKNVIYLAKVKIVCVWCTRQIRPTDHPIIQHPSQKIM